MEVINSLKERITSLDQGVAGLQSKISHHEIEGNKARADLIATNAAKQECERLVKELEDSLKANENEPPKE